MPDLTDDDVLRESRKQVGDMYLASHLEKHDLEQRAADEASSAHRQQHKAEQLAVVAALEAERQRDEDHRVAHHAAHLSHEKLHDAFTEAHVQQHASDQKAREAALASLDKRLDGMNEFRDQLRDQSSTFVRIDRLEAFIATYERAHDEVVQLIRMEREERRSLEAAHALIHRGEEGQKKGISQSTAVLVGAIGLAATVITVVIVVVNFATGTP